MSVGRALVNGALAGLLSGLVFGGAGSRLVMSIIAATGGFHEATFSGTFVFILVTTLIGLTGGLVLALIHRRWPLDWWVGGLITAILIFGAILVEGNWSTMFSEGWPVLNFTLFFLVGFGYGAGWVWITGRWSEL